MPQTIPPERAADFLGKLIRVYRNVWGKWVVVAASEPESWRDCHDFEDEGDDLAHENFVLSVHGDEQSARKSLDKLHLWLYWASLTLADADFRHSDYPS